MMTCRVAAQLKIVQNLLWVEKFLDGPKIKYHQFYIRLVIQRVIRHPDFNTQRDGGGPRLGSDIAVFMVDDTPLRGNKDIVPICLPEQMGDKPGTKLLTSIDK